MPSSTPTVLPALPTLPCKQLADQSPGCLCVVAGLDRDDPSAYVRELASFALHLRAALARLPYLPDHPGSTRVGDAVQVGRQWGGRTGPRGLWVHSTAG